MTLIKIAVVSVWLAISATAAAAETRVALVIGNGAYANVGALDNPSRDAAAVAQALRGAGFQTVQVENDLGHDALLKALRRFEDLADAADWALVYYAGHGIEVGGVNYLIPVDARIRDDRDVEEEAVSLAQVQKRLEGARKLRLVILDACRDNPFLAKMRRTRLASRSVGRGLAVPDLPQTGSLVAYSAAAGQTALDGETAAGNSPYAAALVRNLAVPDVEVNLFFRRVRVDVLRATGNRQEPATYESLPDDRFVVRPDPAAQPAAPPPVAAPGPVAALAPTVPRTALASDRRALIDACDRLAASPIDPDRPPGVPGVAPTAIEGGAAIPACRAAAAVWDYQAAEASTERPIAATSGSDDPQRRRTLFQLGRALGAGGFYGEAKASYERAAALGSVVAMSNLGVLYDRGQGVARDYGAARDWFERAAAGGVTLAMTNLGQMYANGRGVARDDAVALDWYGKAAAGGDANAMNGLGALYAAGHGTAQDYGAALGWYTKAAAADNAPAMNNLGYLYEAGRGAAQDYGAARGWYERAASAGNVTAMINLAGLYANGRGVAQDYVAALGWYERAASAGSVPAMNSIGFLYANGRGVSRDYATARSWYERAAAGGNAVAMANLGALYANGQGVPRDAGLARGWYEKAAAGGSAQAMANLGYLYESGQGVTRDFAVARGWYEKGAAAGSAQAMNNLGWMSESGQGTSRDYSAAKGWYEKAATGGNVVAMRNLGNLYAAGHGVRADKGAARGWYEKAAAAGDKEAAAKLQTVRTR